MAIKDTAVGYSNIEQKRIVVDMSNEIAFLEPSATPLIVLTKKLNTSGTSNPKYEWMDNDLEVRWTKAADDALLDATEIAVTTGTGKYFTADDLIKNTATGEVMKVVSISTDTLTVTRAIGATAGVAVTTDDPILIVGNAAMQGTGAPAENIGGVTPYYNYTQIFKTAFSTTNTLNAVQLYGMEELARLRKQAGIKHAKSMEYAFLFGKKSIDTSGAQPVTTTDGILTSLASNPNNVSKDKASVTEADLMTFCQNIFTYGGDTRTALVSPDILAWFASLVGNKLQVVQSDMDKTYGLNVSKYLTPFGVLNLVMHPLLVSGYSSTMIALATEDIYYRPLRGRDTKLMTNIQAPDEDGQRDMYLTEAGVELRLPLKHGVFTITA